jgi:metallo-beta-lactamase family protein
MHISFHGAADTVAGSRHLLRMGEQRILLDCGLFQGFKVHRERNWLPPSAELLQAAAVVLSHAHLDHRGWLPVLVRHGFHGPVYATPATRDLAEVLLLDSAHLQEEGARRANRYGYSRHAKALPLYTRRDAQRAIAKIVPVAPGREKLCGEVRIGFTSVGHLLGACALTLSRGSERLVFSGELGRSHDLLMPAPQRVEQADVLRVESTYGNRTHPPDDAAARLAGIIRETVQRGGSVLMPAFAVGRAQALMLVLQRLKAAGGSPPSCRCSGTARWPCRPPRRTTSTAACCACPRARPIT